MELAVHPEIPIIDPHHHLWDLTAHLEHLRGHPLLETVAQTPAYLVDALLEDLSSVGSVAATVYMECGSHYRSDGPDHLKPAGEVEFAARVGDECERKGGPRACAAVVGFADLTLGDAALEALEEYVIAGRGRLRGVRQMAAYDADASVLGPTGRPSPGLLEDPGFRRGFRALARLGLSFDAWVLEPQLGDVVSLARAHPETNIVVDHTGSPLGLGSYQGRLSERFAPWSRSIIELARCPNVYMKLGGLGNPLTGFDFGRDTAPAVLAARWRPYFLHCIESFGPRRCMFESNYPVDRPCARYRSIWDAFALVTSGCSVAERVDLFHDTAARFYGLPHRRHERSWSG